jgi:hypothetical protein
MSQRRLSDLERGSLVRPEEFTWIVNELGEVAFHEFKIEIRLSPQMTGAQT